VAVRVGEIHDLSQPEEWRKVPTKLNIADDATKWDDETTYINNRWLQGPPFLLLPKSEWPQQELDKTPVMEEVKKSVYIIKAAKISFSGVPDMSFSKYTQLLRVLAYMLKYMFACKFKISKEERQKLQKLVSQNKLKIPTLSVLDIQRAERCLYKKAQYEIFENEYTTLISGYAINKKSKLLNAHQILAQQHYNQSSYPANTKYRC
jgi:hypothetical protein